MTGSSPAAGVEDSQVRKTQLRVTSVARQFSFEYLQRRQARGGRMPGQWVDVGARRLIDGTALDPRGQTRRPACRCPFARQVASGCAAATVGTIVASLLPAWWDGSAAQAVWAAVWTVAGYGAIWTGLFIYHLWRYRSSGFCDHDWLARHDDSDPGGALFLELIRRSDGRPNLGVDLELCVKSHGNWESRTTSSWSAMDSAPIMRRMRCMT